MARLNPQIPPNEPDASSSSATPASAESCYENGMSKLRHHLKDNAIQTGVLPILLPTYDAAHALARANMHLFKSKAAQDKIWRAIAKCNNDFRTRLNALDRRKCPVETRKLKKAYLGFLVQAQGFFVELVCIIATSDGLAADVRGKIAVDRHFRSLIPELAPLSSSEAPDLAARRVKARKADPELAKACYNAFVHLGDLSRYREQFRGGGRRVGRALEWLDLAIGVMPEQGRAWYQRGVLFVDGTEIRERLLAIHGMYKAASVEHGVAGAAKSLSSFLVGLSWREEVPEGSSVHRLLQYNEPEWKTWVLEGLLFNMPFPRDGFVLDDTGVKSMVT